MSEQDGLPLGKSVMIVEKLDGTNYRMWSIRIAAYLGTEGLWDLMTGTEEVLKVPEKEDTDDKVLQQEYMSQRRRVQKAIRALKLEMADAIVISYNESYWDSARKVWTMSNENYEVLVSYDANSLQMELYECQLEDYGTVRAFLNKLKEIKEKLSLCGQTPSIAQIVFPLFNGLPTTTEWKTSAMVKKPQFSPTVTNSDYIKLQSLLKGFEVKLRREKLIEPGQSLFAPSKNAKWKQHNGELSNCYNPLFSG